MNCPICNSEEECDHLLVIIDRTSRCTTGGFAFEKEHQFMELIHESFLPLLNNEASPKFENQYLTKLWEYESKNYENDSSYVEFDHNVHFDLIEDLFKSFGAEQSAGYDESGMPGFSSVERFYFVKEPKKAFQESLNKLKNLLPTQ